MQSCNLRVFNYTRYLLKLKIDIHQGKSNRKSKYEKVKKSLTAETFKLLQAVRQFLSSVDVRNVPLLRIFFVYENVTHWRGVTMSILWLIILSFRNNSNCSKHSSCRFSWNSTFLLKLILRCDANFNLILQILNLDLTRYKTIFLNKRNQPIYLNNIKKYKNRF